MASVRIDIKPSMLRWAVERSGRDSDLIDRQDWLSNYLRDNGYDKVPFAGIADARTDAEHLSNMILEQLDLSADWALKYNKVDIALKHLTVLMEDRGVPYVGHQG